MHYFPSTPNFQTENSFTGTSQTALNGYGKIISSFQTISGLIINFFLIKTDKTLNSMIIKSAFLLFLLTKKLYILF